MPLGVGTGGNDLNHTRGGGGGACERATTDNGSSVSQSTRSRQAVTVEVGSKNTKRGRGSGLQKPKQERRQLKKPATNCGPPLAHSCGGLCVRRRWRIAYPTKCNACFLLDLADLCPVLSGSPR